MNDQVTQILRAVQAGEPASAAQLLPLVYDELRRVAASHMARELPNHTLNATALVHEAYLRLVGNDPSVPWNHRGHFYAAAAEAMRRILVDHARRRGRHKRGGDRKRVPLEGADIAAGSEELDLVALDEALSRLAVEDPQAAELVQLRSFSGLTSADAAACLGISPRTADRLWAFARAWLYRALSEG